MDEEREQQIQTYQLCRMGFGLISFALALASLTTVLSLAASMVGHGRLNWILNSPMIRWSSVPITWGSLIGVYLLWGRWNDRSWQRRTGVLLIMCMVDGVIWLADHSTQLGLAPEGVGHEWLRSQFGQALGWAEFALIASLACDLMLHLGIAQAPEAGKATRSLAATGAVVWMIQFFDRTQWNTWPLEMKPINSIESLLLALGTEMIWAITLIQVTALTIAATRQTARVLVEMAREDQDCDLLRLPSESHDEDLLAAGSKKFSMDRREL